jgi:bifunctional non-homologous end joining protein LigD
MNRLPQASSTDLDTYHSKRDFERTPEPHGAPPKATGPRLHYVIQRHDARRLHYDLRLEHAGVLKSWAVPKEPTLEPRMRRLAVQTEDHPLEYATFEGEIPEHQYGAGSMVIWDRGYWTPESDAERALEEGKLDFILDGERLHGRFTLVRMESRARRGREDKQNWLLIKRNDNARNDNADAEPLELDAIPGARRAALPERPVPQLATLASKAPDGPGWLYEPKLDGYRLLCRIEGGRAALFTRRGNDWTKCFGAIANAARELPCHTALLDGEAVVFNAQGITDFQRLQTAIGRNDPNIVLVAFDLLYLDGWDLRDVALRARKELLQRLLTRAPLAIRYGEHVEEQGPAFYREACRLGLEGIIAKRDNDPYREGRTRSWLKIKCMQRQEFVIVGFTKPKGTRSGFGALLLGTRERPGEPLRYAGKVGTGFNQRSLTILKRRLEAMQRKDPPVSPESARAAGRDVTWVEPELVAEVVFAEWTGDGVLRHPSFQGLREDKTAEEIVIERPAQEPVSPLPQAPRQRVNVKLTHPEKILFPELGVTKRELARYWEHVAEWALPLLRNRPLTLLRCPEGRDAQCFYQKHVGAAVPKVVPRVTVKPDEDPYVMVDDVDALIGLVQIGALELHVWGSRAEHLEQPDIIVFDLDPDEELPWRAVVEAGFELKERLEALGLAAFARVTGGKGLHVVVPVIPGPTWPAVKQFSHAMVNEMVRDSPQRFTASLAKIRRTGKIFIDYLRNAAEATAIAAYSPRAKPGAPIAMPIDWEALDPNAREPLRFYLRDVPDFLRRRSSDPWAGFESARRSLVD